MQLNKLLFFLTILFTILASTVTVIGVREGKLMEVALGYRLFFNGQPVEFYCLVSSLINISVAYAVYVLSKKNIMLLRVNIGTILLFECFIIKFANFVNDLLQYLSYS